LNDVTLPVDQLKESRKEISSPVIRETAAVRKRSIPEPPTDGELLKRFQQGDEQAFAELYQRRGQDLYRFILRFVRGDTAVAADVFQDTFVTIYEQAAMVRDSEAARAWIYTIARFNCLAALKRSKRQIPLSAEHENIMDTQTPLPDAETNQIILNAQLEQVVHMLPPNQREAVILHDFEGLSYAEVAEVTGTNIGIVRQRLWRAKQTLRIALAPFISRKPMPGKNEDANG
jgi:RNA polymerase sigma-70 factor (ECF subfamily)